ncbi:hypothetical protein CN188_30735 [Sinorhizobium meliloti]|nr:hypothetical protein CN188_30735 [Sinorhizobium meliloti]RVI94370.1 hypothetical protein CN193_30005 [Sinorhizobium meliloti]RVK30847.1 hypothetical protein CN163_26815 [Sinorhizobium meliloti]
MRDHGHCGTGYRSTDCRSRGRDHYCQDPT